MANVRHSILQCSYCGRHESPDSNGELHQCVCGSWHYVELTRAVWRISPRDYQTLRQNRIDPEVFVNTPLVPDASEEA